MQGLASLAFHIYQEQLGSSLVPRALGEGGEGPGDEASWVADESVYH